LAGKAIIGEIVMVRFRSLIHSLFATALVACAVTAASGIVAVRAQEQAQAEQEQVLQTVVVTGSMIKRTNTGTPSPVQVISSEDLQASGYTTVSDVLRNLSANGAGTLSQAFNSAFAGGGAGIALRGLSVGATLTLIDGHRMVGYPLTDDGERNFVDVTAIPFNAVERVEVLKDGASAEYGSDAIAGVVNIILKKNYTGAELTAEAGESQRHDGTMTRVAAIWGTGDLGSDGHNFYVTGEYRRQNEILFSSRTGDFTNLDYRGVGGFNTTPGAGSNPLGQGSSGFPASLTGYLANPTAPTNGVYPNGLPAQAFLPGCSAAAQAADRCTFSDAGLQIQPPTTSASLFAKFTKNLGGDWQAITSASVFETKAQQAGVAYFPTGFPGGLVQIGLPPFGAPNVVIAPPITVPANYPGNPYGAPAQLAYNFGELGFPYAQFKTDTYRLVQEFNGTAAGWDIGLSGGYMYSILDTDAYGNVKPAALQTALNDGYILGSASGASKFAPVAQSTASSYLFFGNVHASHALTALPGGDLALALGAEYFEKKLNATAAPSSVDGSQAGLADAWSIGSQADTAVFAELSAPLLHELEVNGALRYDHYNTAAGGSATPKIGIKYTPIAQLAIRGTWGKGFRAPSIPEVSSGLSFLANTIADPVLCPGGNPATVGNFPSQCSVQLVGVQPGNPLLKPEKTTNYTVGIIYEPARAFSVSVDYYDIKVNQDIISAFEAGGLGFTGIGGYQRLGPQVSLPQTQANGTTANALTPVPLITYKSYPYVNASQDETNGLDLDLKSVVDLGRVGRLTSELTYTRIFSYRLEAPGVNYQLAGTHGPSGVSGDTGNPKDRATLSLTWDQGPASVTANINYIGSFTANDPSAGQPTCASAIQSAFTLEFGNRFSNSFTGFPSSYCKVASFTDLDLYGQYQFNNHFSVHASILNALDRPPPFDATTYGGGGGAAYSTLEQTGAVGRFYTVGATYKF
jgi:iron complex outermembrane receptor protein